MFEENTTPSDGSQVSGRTECTWPDTAFFCQEPQCEGVLDARTTVHVTISVSSVICPQSIKCPECGRLYWPHDKTAIISAFFDKIFCKKDPSGNSTFVHQPLTSAEKSKVIEVYIEKAKRCGTDIREIGINKSRLRLLEQLEHSMDCPMKQGQGECKCGYLKVFDWLEHQNSTHHQIQTV
jgi:hypothetical protein